MQSSKSATDFDQREGGVKELGDASLTGRLAEQAKQNVQPRKAVRHSVRPDRRSDRNGPLNRLHPLKLRLPVLARGNRHASNDRASCYAANELEEQVAPLETAGDHIPLGLAVLTACFGECGEE